MSTSYSTDLFTIFFQKPVYLNNSILMHFSQVNPTELKLMSWKRSFLSWDIVDCLQSCSQPLEALQSFWRQCIYSAHENMNKTAQLIDNSWLQNTSHQNFTGCKINYFFTTWKGQFSLHRTAFQFGRGITEKQNRDPHLLFHFQRLLSVYERFSIYWSMRHNWTHKEGKSDFHLMLCFKRKMQFKEPA